MGQQRDVALGEKGEKEAPSEDEAVKVNEAAAFRLESALLVQCKSSDSACLSRNGKVQPSTQGRQRSKCKSRVRSTTIQAGSRSVTDAVESWPSRRSGRGAASCRRPGARVSGTRRPARMHSHAASAYAGPAAPCGSPSGTAPFCTRCQCGLSTWAATGLPKGKSTYLGL